MLPQIFSAPMADVTNPACRALFEMHGADFTFTEMINSDGLLYGDSFANDAGFSITKKPYGIQISGNNPKSISKAAEILEDMFSPSVIDINMGCPSPRIMRSGCGASLMNDEKLASQIISDVCSVLKTPVSAKIRIFENSEKTVSFAKSLECAGISSLAVHGRTREMFYSGTCNTKQIREIVSSLSILVIANGNVFDGLGALSLINETGTSNIMIGRATIGNPFIFFKMKRFFKTAEKLGIDWQNIGPEEFKENINSKRSTEKTGNLEQFSELKQINSTIFKNVLDQTEIEQRISDFKLYCKLIEKNNLYSRINIKAHAQWFTKGFPDSCKLRLQINDLHKNIKIPLNDIDALVEDRIILSKKIIEILDERYL